MPWLKTGDMMDYVLAVVPRRTFGVHDLTPPSVSTWPVPVVLGPSKKPAAPTSSSMLEWTHRWADEEATEPLPSLRDSSSTANRVVDVFVTVLELGLDDG